MRINKAEMLFLRTGLPRAKHLRPARMCGSKVSRVHLQSSSMLLMVMLSLDTTRTSPFRFRGTPVGGRSALPAEQRAPNYFGRGERRRGRGRGVGRRCAALRKQRSRRFPPSDGDGGAKEITITLSAGVAARSVEMSSHHDLLRTADRALYQAKDAGRNQIRRESSMRRAG